MTISQGLGWMKVLKQRHQELVSLRNENSQKIDRLFGEQKVITKEPVYDVKKLDKMVNRVAMEIRKLDDSIKETNARTKIEAYEKDEAALGELE